MPKKAEKTEVEKKVKKPSEAPLRDYFFPHAAEGGLTVQAKNLQEAQDKVEQLKKTSSPNN